MNAYTLERISGPEAELLLLSEAKDHLRVLNDDDIQVIQEKLRAARAYIENQIGKPIGRQVFEIKLRDWPWWRAEFPRWPFLELIKITYRKDDGTVVVYYDPAASPAVDPDTLIIESGGQFWPGELWLKSTATWPADTLDDGWPVVIQFAAGIEVLTPNLRAAWLLMLAHLYENREATAEKSLSHIPLAVESLCAIEASDRIA